MRPCFSSKDSLSEFTIEQNSRFKFCCFHNFPEGSTLLFVVSHELIAIREVDGAINIASSSPERGACSNVSDTALILSDTEGPDKSTEWRATLKERGHCLLVGPTLN